MYLTDQKLKSEPYYRKCSNGGYSVEVRNIGFNQKPSVFVKVKTECTEKSFDKAVEELQKIIGNDLKPLEDRR